MRSGRPGRYLVWLKIDAHSLWGQGKAGEIFRYGVKSRAQHLFLPHAAKTPGKLVVRPFGHEAQRCIRIFEKVHKAKSLSRKQAVIEGHDVKVAVRTAGIGPDFKGNAQSCGRGGGNAVRCPQFVRRVFSIKARACRKARRATALIESRGNARDPLADVAVDLFTAHGRIADIDHGAARFVMDKLMLDNAGSARAGNNGSGAVAGGLLRSVGTVLSGGVGSGGMGVIFGRGMPGRLYGMCDIAVRGDFRHISDGCEFL